MKTLKRGIREFIAYSLYLSGILTILAKIRLKGKVVVLMYHRILDKHEISQSFSQDGIVVSKRAFEAQMRYLKKNFNVISLSALIERIRNGVCFDNKSCLVTFDDGWKDNFTNAFPILEKYKIPAVVFLATDFIGSGKLFWQERLTELLKVLHDRCSKDPRLRERALTDLEPRGLEQIILSNRNQLKDRISRLIKLQKAESPEKVEELVQALSALIGPSHNKIGRKETFLTWPEIRIMSEAGIEFGSHGISHTILTKLGSQAFREIKESKQMIEQELGTQINSFTYPNGEFTEVIINMVKNNAYDVAFGTESGFVSMTDDPHKLKRINIHDDMTRTMPMFLARVVGLW